jgi:UDP-arabinose 4-epimerase
MAETVLVAGGAGFVGSHVCKALARSGFHPVVYDNLASGHRWAVRWGPFELGDLLDPAQLDAVLRRHRPAAVINLAAFAAAGESVANPAEYYGNNVQSLLTLLRCMRNCGIDRIVFSSSAAVYGDPCGVPIREDAAALPVNPYGHSKAMCEQILRDFGSAYGLKSISLRYFNAAGADPDGEIGEARTFETHLIPLVLDAALGRRPCIDVYGDDYDTRDGTCLRDYVHVADLAEAHVRALQRLEGNEASRSYNLGSGSGATVLEVIGAVERVTGRRIAQRRVPRRVGDPPCLVADATLAARELGWRPRYAEVDCQIEHAWRWRSNGLAAGMWDAGVAAE